MDAPMHYGELYGKPLVMGVIRPVCGANGTVSVFPDTVTCQACRAMLPSLGVCKHETPRGVRCAECERDHA